MVGSALENVALTRGRWQLRDVMRIPTPREPN